MIMDKRMGKFNICVKSNLLTYGSFYEIIEETEDEYIVINNRNELCRISKLFFCDEFWG